MLIAEALRRNGIVLSNDAVSRLARFGEILLMANKEFNLTAITDPAEIAVKHFADSLASLDFFPKGALCADVGSGAGFPAIPLLIARPDLRFTLIDSLAKRVTFLSGTLTALGLKSSCAVHARAEDLAKAEEQTGGKGKKKDTLRGHIGLDNCRGTFDVATARAVAPLPTLLEYLLPLLKLNGIAVIYKAKGVEEEIGASAKALPLLGGKVEQIKYFELDGKYERNIIVVRKVKETPPAYPRGGNKPKTNPL